MKYDLNNLVVHPNPDPNATLITRITPADAGWDFIHFEARRLRAGQSHQHDAGENELAIVVLSGMIDVTTSRGQFLGVGERKNVFAGKPEAVYLPRRTTCRIQAANDCEFALGWCATDQDHPPRWIHQSNVPTEIRGGDNATRHINGIIPPGFDCQRLVIVEVYTPGGNWSSYPPHKHDVHRVDMNGKILEVKQEEVYFYKIDKPEGYAYQRVYTDEYSSFQQAGNPFDAVVMARNNDAVLIPGGYHPVCSPPGYTTYYLNVLAGSAQSLANFEDPQYAWVKETYVGKDARVPIY